MIKIIAAVGKNLELGKKGNLIWHLPNDLKFFKLQTGKSPVAMGSVTFNSLPRLLPKRHHIIISYDDNFNKDVSDCTVVYNKEDFLKIIEEIGNEEDVFIIGGASIYKMCIDLAEEIYLTEVEEEDADADAYFPQFDKSKYKMYVIGKNSDGDINYNHILYKKRNF